MNGITKLGNMTQASMMIQNAKNQQEGEKFADLIQRMKDKEADNSHISSEQIVKEGRLNGDYSTGFDGSFTSEADKEALPRGAAANSASRSSSKTIDKTSKLYEKSLELESYFVKMMINSMRKAGTGSEKNSFAKNMYEDMLFDEYSTALTKNAGFGIADQIYMQLSQKN